MSRILICCFPSDVLRWTFSHSGNILCLIGQGGIAVFSARSMFTGQWMLRIQTRKREVAKPLDFPLRFQVQFRLGACQCPLSTASDFFFSAAGPFTAAVELGPSPKFKSATASSGSSGAG